MAKSRTKKQRNRMRRRRFACGWQKDGGAAALKAAQLREQAAHEKKAKQLSRPADLTYNPIQSRRPVSLSGMGYRADAHAGISKGPLLDPATQRLLTHVRRAPSRQ